MSTVLAVNTSKSNPSKQHRIIEGNDGVIYCECMGWKMHRDCTHLRRFHAGTPGQFAPVPKKNVPKVPAKTRQSLQETIDAAVELINGGR